MTMRTSLRVLTHKDEESADGQKQRGQTLTRMIRTSMMVSTSIGFHSRLGSRDSSTATRSSRACWPSLASEDVCQYNSAGAAALWHAGAVVEGGRCDRVVLHFHMALGGPIALVVCGAGRSPSSASSIGRCLRDEFWEPGGGGVKMLAAELLAKSSQVRNPHQPGNMFW